MGQFNGFRAVNIAIIHSGKKHRLKVQNTWNILKEPKGHLGLSVFFTFRFCLASRQTFALHENISPQKK